MKVKTTELIGPALDWAVATIEGYGGLRRNPHAFDQALIMNRKDGQCVLFSTLNYATDWAHGGPIVDREGISTIRVLGDLGEAKVYYVALRDDCAWESGYGPYHEQDEERSLRIYKDECVNGPTQLIAAMRCYCCDKLGGIIDIPEELCQQLKN